MVSNTVYKLYIYVGGGIVPFALSYRLNRVIYLYIRLFIAYSTTYKINTASIKNTIL